MENTGKFCFTHSLSGKDIYLFTLGNDKGTQVFITNYGAILMAYKIKDANGNANDIVLGFDKVEDYLQPAYLAQYPYFGAAIGRYANRIKESRFTIDEKEIQVAKNWGEDQLHGGFEGFDKKVWDFVSFDRDCSILELSYMSKDNEEGYPGNLLVNIKYELNDENDLIFTYTAETDQPTAVNLSHHSYFNLNNGEGDIMDHFAVTFGEKDKAILLNCDTLDYQLLPFDTREYVLAIINTNKQRKLVESKYNERFAECGYALKALKQVIDVKNLCDLDLDSFYEHMDVINDPVLEKRALHVVSENSRVHAATQALQFGKLKEFGQLMYASHQSLKELYEVSGPELDTIVEFCKGFEGCLGARMTGAGFGGCAIALVKKEKMTDFTNQLTSFYKNRIGYEPGIFASAIGNGVRHS